MSITFEELKKAYPNPVRYDARQSRKTEYCVGGAFCMGVAGFFYSGFPSTGIIREALRDYNFALSDHCANSLAHDIAIMNDAGDFAGAWDALEQAMNYRGEGES